MLTAGLGGFLFIYTMISDLKSDLVEINKLATMKKTHVQATKELCEFVQIHTLAKELSVHQIVLKMVACFNLMKILPFKFYTFSYFIFSDF